MDTTNGPDLDITTEGVASETLGQRIRRLRIDGGMTQAELGNVLGHTRHARASHRVQDWESGDSAPRICDLPDVARALHCSCDYLLSGVNFA